MQLKLTPNQFGVLSILIKNFNLLVEADTLANDARRWCGL
jgi:hypothetical protein